MPSTSPWQGCVCRLCLASTSHDTTLRLWDLGMLQDGADEEEELPQQVPHCDSHMLVAFSWHHCCA